MFGKTTKNAYRPPTDPEALKKEHNLILEKRSKLSCSERAKVLVAYVQMEMKQREKKDDLD